MTSLALITLVLPAAASELFNGRQYWIGDPHAHSGVSADANDKESGGCDACGTMEGFYETARHNGLDWVAPVDHINGERAGDAAAWSEHLAAGLAADQAHPDLTVLPATEVWLTDDDTSHYGHLSFFMFGDDATVGALTLADVQPLGNASTAMESCDAIWAWVDQFSEDHGPTLAIPHHPGVLAPSGWDWTCLDEPLSPVVEVYSEHGNSMGDGLEWDPPWGGVKADGTVHEAIDPDGYGWKLGFLAGTDEHDTLPGSVCDPDNWTTVHPYGGGLTIVVTPPAPELSRGMIHEAFVARHTMATTGPMLPFDVAFSSASGRLGSFGDELPLPAGEDLLVQLGMPIGAAGMVTEVVLVSPTARLTMNAVAAGIWSASIPADAVESWYYAAVKIDGAAWYGGGCADGGVDDDEWIWASPAWIVDTPMRQFPPEDTADTGGSVPDGESGTDPDPVDSASDPEGQQGPSEGKVRPILLAPRVGCGLGLGASAPASVVAALLIRRRVSKQKR